VAYAPIPNETIDKYKGHIVRAHEYATALPTEVLKKIHPQLAKQWPSEYVRGLSEQIDGMARRDTTAMVHGPLRVNNFVDWWNENRSAFKLPKQTQPVRRLIGFDGMLERELFDHLDWWPWAIPFLLFEVILYRIFRFNRALETEGTLSNLYKGAVGNAFAAVFYIPASIFCAVMFLYLLYVCGWIFLATIPLVALAMLPALVLGLVPFAQYVLPIICCVLALMQCVLLGFFHIASIGKLNVLFFSLFG
jgi:hypothetical protein